MKNRIANYNIVFNPEPGGGFTVTVPVLPGCVSYGETLEEARKMVKEAILLYLESLENLDETIPTEDKTLISPMSVALPPRTKK